MSVDRRAIQNVIAPAIEQAMSAVPSFDMSDEAHQRRFFRALVHIGARELMLRGVSIKDLAGHVSMALAHEFDEYKQSIASASSISALILPQTAQA